MLIATSHCAGPLGYKLRKPARHLRAFAGYAASRGETVRPDHDGSGLGDGVGPDAGRSSRALPEIWRCSRASFTPKSRRHEVPARNPFAVRKTRPIPYIYTSDEIARILDAAGTLRRQRPNPLRAPALHHDVRAHRRNGSARLGGDCAFASTMCGRTVCSAHPRDQVLQEPARPAAPDRRRGARPLSGAAAAYRRRQRLSVPVGAAPRALPGPGICWSGLSLNRWGCEVHALQTNS